MGKAELVGFHLSRAQTLVGPAFKRNITCDVRVFLVSGLKSSKFRFDCSVVLINSRMVSVVWVLVLLVSKRRVPSLQVIPEDTLWDYRPDAPEVSLIRFTCFVFC